MNKKLLVTRLQENSQKMNFWGPVPRYRTPSDGDHNNDDDDDDDDDDDADDDLEEEVNDGNIFLKSIVSVISLICIQTWKWNISWSWIRKS